RMPSHPELEPAPDPREAFEPLTLSNAPDTLAPPLAAAAQPGSIEDIIAAADAARQQNDLDVAVAPGNGYDTGADALESPTADTLPEPPVPPLSAPEPIAPVIESRPAETRLGRARGL